MEAQSFPIEGILTMMDQAIDFLLNAQNPDGGWGAGKERRSNTEATSFALMALSSLEAKPLRVNIDRGLGWLSRRQHPDGSWPLTDQLGESSWTTALAILSLALFDSHRQRALQGVDWLLGQKGKTRWLNSFLNRWASRKVNVPLNPDLKGWPWTAETFSWVEPTAYALIALKKLKPYLQGTRAEERIHQGELMIYDRMCEEGGWNYGNSKVLGENLWPYPDVTAVALIALQDHQAAEANQRSFQALLKMLPQVESGLTLSWSILCLSLYGEDGAVWKKVLARNYEKMGFLGETKTMALALLASGNGAKVLRI